MRVADRQNCVLQPARTVNVINRYNLLRRLTLSRYDQLMRSRPGICRHARARQDFVRGTVERPDSLLSQALCPRHFAAIMP